MSTTPDPYVVIHKAPASLVENWNQYASASETDRLELAKDLSEWEGSLSEVHRRAVRAEAFAKFLTTASEDLAGAMAQRSGRSPADRTDAEVRLADVIHASLLEAYAGQFRAMHGLPHLVQQQSIWETYKMIAVMRDECIRRQTGEENRSGLSKPRRQSWLSRLRARTSDRG